MRGGDAIRLLSPLQGAEHLCRRRCEGRSLAGTDRGNGACFREMGEGERLQEDHRLRHQAGLVAHRQKAELQAFVDCHDKGSGIMGGSTHTESSNKIDPQLMALYQQNYATASDVANAPFQPYSGERVAGFNTNQLAGNNALLAAATDPTAINGISRAQNSAGGLMNYRAPVVAAPSPVAPTNVTAGQLAGTDLSQYLNPYTDSVINSTLADLERARGQQQVTDNAS